jgi:Superinfection immunity protein
MTTAAVLPATTSARMSLYLGAVAVIAVWLVPLIIAWLYGLPRKGAIAVLSLALGWTGVAWLAALVIAVAGAIRAPTPREAGSEAFPAAASPRERPDTARRRGERPPSPAARQPEQVPDRPPQRAYERTPQRAHERTPERAYERQPQGAHEKSSRQPARTPERAYERPPQRASGGRYEQ